MRVWTVLIVLIVKLQIFDDCCNWIIFFILHYLFYYLDSISIYRLWNSESILLLISDIFSNVVTVCCIRITIIFNIITENMLNSHIYIYIFIYIYIYIYICAYIHIYYI